MVKRKNYISFRGFQASYIWMTVLLASFVAVVSAVVVFVTVAAFEAGFEYRGPGQVVVTEKITKLAHDINSLILITLLFIFPIIVIVSVLVSHKISGPLVRIKKAIHAISRGEFAHEVNIRKDDALRELADDLNEIIRKVRSMLDNNDAVIKTLTSELAVLKKELEQSGQVDRSFQEKIPVLKKQVDSIERQISKIKLYP